MKYDVIIVLAGGIKEDGTLPKSVIERIYKAQELFKRKYAPRILMSGRWSRYWEKHGPPPITEAESMKRFAHSIGIPKKAIFKEEKSYDTRSNAHYCKNVFLEKYAWKKIVVVTSDFHISRAQHIFDTQLDQNYKSIYVAAKAPLNPIKRLNWYIREKAHTLKRNFSDASRFTE